MINVVIQGLGFVGSATAFALASKQKNKKPIFNIIGIDQKTVEGKRRINSINKGNFPFINLDKKIRLLTTNSFKHKNIKASSSTKYYAKADIVLVSINCDIIVNDKKEDIQLNSFLKSLEIIFLNIKEGTLIILQSTIPPGTTKNLVYPKLIKILKNRKIDTEKVYLAHSYERVMPGENYLDSIINYWRVYSGINDKSANKCEEFFKKIINVKKYPMTRLENTNSSELSKVLENSYRAVNIAFIDEWSKFSEEIGVNLYQVIDAIKKRPTHSNLRYPGFGVGGYCLTKDPLFAKISAKKIFKLNDQNFEFSSKAIKINQNMPLNSLKKIENFFNYNLNNTKILIMGIAYKGGLDDTRFSPSEIFYKKAKSKGAKLFLNDPFVKKWSEINKKVDQSLISPNKINCIIFCVNHSKYKKINFKKWINTSNSILIIDAVNVLSEKQKVQISQNMNITFKTIGVG